MARKRLDVSIRKKCQLSTCFSNRFYPPRCIDNPNGFFVGTRRKYLPLILFSINKQTDYYVTSSSSKLLFIESTTTRLFTTYCVISNLLIFTTIAPMINTIHN